MTKKVSTSSKTAPEFLPTKSAVADVPATVTSENVVTGKSIAPTSSAMQSAKQSAKQSGKQSGNQAPKKALKKSKAARKSTRGKRAVKRLRAGL